MLPGILIQIWAKILSVLIWVQTVCQVDQKMTKVAANGKKKS